MKKDYGDLTINELLERARMWIEAGWTVYFKFTCEKCGSRRTFTEPNTIYEYGKCEECGHITRIKKGGFMVVGLL